VRYCTNKPKSTELLVAHGGAYFVHLQQLAALEQPIAAYLIKPVQRSASFNYPPLSVLRCIVKLV
jgi:triple functional domain protein